MSAGKAFAPLLQRALHFRDVQAAGSFATLMVMGALTTALKDLMRGDDPRKRWEVQGPEDAYKLGIELINRSGLNAYLGPYMDAGSKLLGLGGASRYQRNGWAASLLGVNAALIGDAERFGAAVAGGDPKDQIAKKAIALAPYSNLLRLGYHLYEDR